MAKGNDSSNLDRLAEQIKAGLADPLTDPLAGQVDATTAIDATEAILSDTAGAGSAESAPLSETPAAAIAPPPAIPADLGAFVANLSADQLARVRALAQARGISAGPQKGPNGGLMIMVEVPAEAVEPLSVWAEESGSSLTEFISKVAGDAIVNYCFGDWGATTVQPVTPAPVAAPVAAATTT